MRRGRRSHRTRAARPRPPPSARRSRNISEGATAMRNGRRVIDTDCHQIEPPDLWVERIEPRFRDRAPRIGDYHGTRTMMVEGEPFTDERSGYRFHSPEFLAALRRGMERFARLREAGFGAAARLADMDEHGVDVQVLYPTSGGQMLGRVFEDVELLAACCRAYNDWSADYCAAAPDRLRWAAILPLQAVDLAVEEARRTAARGAAAYYLRPNPICGRNLYHHDHAPLWAEVERLGVPLSIHDSGSPHLPSFGKRLETHTSGHIIAHPFEAMATMVGLIWYGIFERIPISRCSRRRTSGATSSSPAVATSAPCRPPSSSPATTTSPSTPTTRIPT